MAQMTKCRKCGAEIKFIKTPGGKWLPVDAKPVYYSLIGKKDRVVYVPHWATCEFADEFRGVKRG